MKHKMKWVDDENLEIGDNHFRITFDPQEYMNVDSKRNTFMVAKARAMIEKLLEMTSSMEVKNIFELGILKGGSTALYYELFRPGKLVAIEYARSPVVALDQLIEEENLSDTVKPFYGVDQSDRVAMERILEENFPERNIDLVIDDASHLYDETRASFNMIFPYMSPGGLYVIEDWAWAHWAGKEWQGEGGHYGDRPALTNLIFELVMLCPSRPDLIVDILITFNTVFIRRGFGEFDHGSFDISNHYLTRGKFFRPRL